MTFLSALGRVLDYKKSAIFAGCAAVVAATAGSLVTLKMVPSTICTKLREMVVYIYPRYHYCWLPDYLTTVFN